MDLGLREIRYGCFSSFFLFFLPSVSSFLRFLSLFSDIVIRFVCVIYLAGGGGGFK